MSRRVRAVKTIVIVPSLATGSERTGPKRTGPPSPPALVETVITYLLDVQRVKVCVDQANVASPDVPRKLGSHLARVGARYRGEVAHRQGICLATATIRPKGSS